MKREAIWVPRLKKLWVESSIPTYEEQIRLLFRVSIGGGHIGQTDSER